MAALYPYHLISVVELQNKMAAPMQLKWDVASSAASTQMILILIPRPRWSLLANQNALCALALNLAWHNCSQGGGVPLRSHVTDRHILTILVTPYATKNIRHYSREFLVNLLLTPNQSMEAKYGGYAGTPGTTSFRIFWEYTIFWLWASWCCSNNRIKTAEWYICKISRLSCDTKREENMEATAFNIHDEGKFGLHLCYQHGFGLWVQPKEAMIPATSSSSQVLSLTIQFDQSLQKIIISFHYLSIQTLIKLKWGDFVIFPQLWVLWTIVHWWDSIETTSYRTIWYTHSTTPHFKKEWREIPTLSHVKQAED